LLSSAVPSSACGQTPSLRFILTGAISLECPPGSNTVAVICFPLETLTTQAQHQSTVNCRNLEVSLELNNLSLTGTTRENRVC